MTSSVRKSEGKLSTCSSARLKFVSSLLQNCQRKRHEQIFGKWFSAGTSFPLRTLKGAGLSSFQPPKQPAHGSTFLISYLIPHIKRPYFCQMPANRGSATVTCLDKNGNQICREQLAALPPHGTDTLKIANLVSSTVAADVMLLRVDSNQPFIGMQISGVEGGDLVGLPAVSSFSKEVLIDLAQLIQEPARWLSVGLLNPQGKEIEIDLSLLDADGREVVTLNPVLTPSEVVRQIATATLADGTADRAVSLRIRGREPFGAYGVFGNRNTWAVAADILETNTSTAILSDSSSHQLLLAPAACCRPSRRSLPIQWPEFCGTPRPLK